MMICLREMQGIGKPGVNLGNMQRATPLDLHFYFPGYAEGGISGDLHHTAMSVELYQRMPQLQSLNTVEQSIPRLWLPEAITEGKKVVWPTRKETVQMTLIVFVLVVIMAIFLAFVDIGFSYIINLLLGRGG